MTESEELSRASKFATAGLAGVMGWVVVHPFNTLAVRQSLYSGPGNRSIIPFAREIIQKEGFLTLYRGLSAGVTRQIFYATSRFGLYEVLRDQMAKYRDTDLLSRLITGCVSGGIAAMISCPAEVSLVRMSNDQSLAVADRRNYTSIVNAATRIASEEGIATFWRGSMPFVNRAMLVGACQVGTFDQFKVWYVGMGVPRGTPEVFAASMSAGLIYSIITMPFESAKNRMAFERPDKVTGKRIYNTTIQTITTVARSEGVLALWNGFLPYYGRCGGHTVSMFVFLEWIRSALVKAKTNE